MPKKNVHQQADEISKNVPQLKQVSKENALNLLRAACNRNKQKKTHTGQKDDHFSLEDVEVVLSQSKKGSGVKPPETETVKESVDTPANTVTKLASENEEPQEKRVLQAASLNDILGFNPQNTRANRSAYDLNEESKVAEKFKAHYRELIKLRHQLKEEIAYLTKSSLQESAGDVARYTTDQSSDYFEQEIALGLVSNEKETLKEVEAALERIFDGTYGICEITGKPILKKRLDSVPYTRYSLEGQQQVEEMQKNQKPSQAMTGLRTSDDEEGLLGNYYSEELDNEE